MQEFDPLLNKTSHSLLKRVGVSDVNSATFDQKQRFFLLVIREFLSGELSFDHMSVLAEMFVRKPDLEDSEEVRKLDSALLSCSELSFYIRKIDSLGTETFNTLMSDVLEYFASYKHILGFE